jgi:hypothetical protein
MILMHGERKDPLNGERVEPNQNFEITAERLVDQVLNGFVDSHVPVLPAIIAESLAAVLCPTQATDTERRKCFAEMLTLVRWRLELLEVSMQGTPN